MKLDPENKKSRPQLEYDARYYRSWAWFWGLFLLAYVLAQAAFN